MRKSSDALENRQRWAATDYRLAGSGVESDCKKQPCFSFRVIVFNYFSPVFPVIDDFSACKIEKKQDWIDLYAKPFYFGCEADDRMNSVAFGKNNPFGSKLNAIYSSDIGHFDVIDMRNPLPEAYELFEEGFITADNFRDFVFANTVHLWGTQNPKFFEGTMVAKAAAAELARGKAHVTVN